MTNPFQQAGPAITPKSTPGGGDARPPYLQTRTKPKPGPFQQIVSGSKPVVTPKSSVVPGEVKPQVARGMPPVSPPPGANPMANPKPPQAGGQTLADVYKFFQSDLKNQANQAKAGAVTDAANRGVYYGSPLTGSEADIDTQYLRGLGQFQAGMFGNQQQNELQRLQLAMGLTGQNQQGQPPMPGPVDFSGLGSIFGAQPAVAGQRQGPTVTPKQPPLTRTGDSLKPKPPVEN